ncbi:MAG: hypothetical protein IJX71_06715 [Oscillospiraceae bacterium]|nr:hypothetical protein [Oscillospiraceae bacterium]
MDTEKKSTYKGFTEAQARANKKYIEKFEELRARVPKGQKAVIQAHAEQRGESVNAFIIRAVSNQIERDNAE